MLLITVSGQRLWNIDRRLNADQIVNWSRVSGSWAPTEWLTYCRADL